MAVELYKVNPREWKAKYRAYAPFYWLKSKQIEYLIWYYSNGVEDNSAIVKFVDGKLIELDFRSKVEVQATHRKRVITSLYQDLPKYSSKIIKLAPEQLLTHKDETLRSLVKKCFEK